MAASHPDEWLHQTTDQTVQPKITLHRDQADAIFAGIDQYLMIHGFVAQIKIARSEMSAFMGEVTG
jgi:hypothetical protein